MNKVKNISCIVLALCLLLTFASPVIAAGGEQDEAVRYLTERGVFESGDFDPESGLTRAELARIITRLDFTSAMFPSLIDPWQAWGHDRFSDPERRLNPFTDIPDWALPYVEYCYQFSWMGGVGGNRFDPEGEVTPKMACAVMLRYYAVTKTDWDYDTAVAKAQELGIASADIGGGPLSQGEMAVIVYRGIQYGEANKPLPADVPVLAVAPMSVPAPPPEVTAPSIQEPAMTIEEMKAEIVRLTNIERVKAGVPELEVLPELMDCAQAKGQDFLDNNYFGHDSPVYGTSGEMINMYIPHVRSTAENIGTWSSTPGQAVKGWVNSPGHYEVMVSSKYTHIGVGIVQGSDGGYAWIQQFAAI